MKKLLLLAFIVLSSVTSFAQDGQLDDKFVDYIVDTERRTVFVQAMDISEDDAKIFWEIYDQFEEELSPLRKDYVDNVKKFVDNYDTMTDELADEIAITAMKLTEQRGKLTKKYYGIMKKALGATIAARFIQIDAILMYVMKLDVADQLPLMGDR